MHRIRALAAFAFVCSSAACSSSSSDGSTSGADSGADRGSTSSDSSGDVVTTDSSDLSDSRGVDSVTADAPDDAADASLDATDSGAPVKCTSGGGGGGPDGSCSLSLGSCSDGHRYSLVCDKTTCKCEIDDVPTGATTPTAPFCSTPTTAKMNAACGWNLVG